MTKKFIITGSKECIESDEHFPYFKDFDHGIYFNNAKVNWIEINKNKVRYTLLSSKEYAIGEEVEGEIVYQMKALHNFKEDWIDIKKGYYDESPIKENVRIVVRAVEANDELDAETIKGIEEMADETYGGSEAIMFAEWLVETNYAEKETWGKRDPPSATPSITELYKLYKQNEHDETNRRINRR